MNNNEINLILDSFTYFWFSIIQISFAFVSLKSKIIDRNTYNSSLVQLLENNGPVYIKFGQIMSSRKDQLIKNKTFKNLFQNLSKLEDNITLDDDILNEEYNLINTIENIKLCNTKAIGTGSIASVYFVKYFDKECVLKIVHPKIREKVKRGYILLKTHINMISLFTNKIKNIKKIIDIDNMYNSILDQTNMYNESINIYNMYNCFKDNRIIITPKLINYSTDFILMSKEYGLKFDDFIKKYPDYKMEVIATMFYSFKKMIENKLIHIDLHFGNFFFKLDKKNDIVKIILLDFGIMKKINDMQKEELLKIFNFKKISNKFIWLLLKDNKYNYKDFNKLIEEYSKNNKKKNLNDISIFLQKKKIFISYENTLFMNSIDFIFKLRHKIINPKIFDKYLIGYIMENE
jgi:predicted unusual protein kinase regulating ubiquinone biosynthesis (AarF/ABC1/UbiB family)